MRHKDFVPDWAKDAVWYQIFPERFRNGSRKNDPEGVLPWGMDWYRQTAREKKYGDFFKSVYHRRFGGDLMGVREKLGYLEELGVNAIYLNPIFLAPSLHKYDASCLHHIDPTFGPDRDGDFKKLAKAKETEDPATWIWTAADLYFLELVEEVHRRGMRIILDGVFNHTGRDFFAFQDLLKNGKKSRYRDWYKIKTWNADGSFEYDGWFDHKMLPEFAQEKNNLVRPVRDYIFDITRRWMGPKGVDGWRLDVAFCVPHGFWKSWRKLVKKINPEAYLTAEIVTLADAYLKGDEFDAVMNYMWLYPTVAFFSPSARPISSSQLQRRLDEVRKSYPDCVNEVNQNLFDSHDVARVATMLENRVSPFKQFQEYFESSRVYSKRDFVTTRPSAKTYRILKQMVVFQMTYPGAPMIYYGTEVGMWGANDPDDRHPMLWEAIKYEDERTTICGKCLSRARKPNRGVFRFYQKMIALRKKHAVLRRGSLQWLRTGHSRLLAFVRCDETSRALVVLNAGDRVAVYRGVRVKPRGWHIFIAPKA